MICPSGKTEKQFFELLRYGELFWLYRDTRLVGLSTALLDNAAFRSLDDTSQVLLVTLWLYAGRTGKRIFPARPAWLQQFLSLFDGTPDLGPLLNANDEYGNPAPFVRYCDPPSPNEKGA